MRKIKFRAWDKKRKGFINGFNMFGYSTGQGAPTRTLQRFSDEWNEEDIELEQYTGINDELEKEICEGDIVKRISMAPGGIDFEGEVKFAEGQYWITNKTEAIPLFNEIDSMFICGNIHEGFAEYLLKV